MIAGMLGVLIAAACYLGGFLHASWLQSVLKVKDSQSQTEENHSVPDPGVQKFYDEQFAQGKSNIFF